jgi:hypothetical protein
MPRKALENGCGAAVARKHVGAHGAPSPAGGVGVATLSNGSGTLTERRVQIVSHAMTQISAPGLRVVTLLAVSADLFSGWLSFHVQLT